MSGEEVFQGGVNMVRRQCDVIHRPAGEHSATVQRLLAHLRQQGFDGAPRPLGFDEDGNEVLSYVPGAVHGTLPEQLRTPELLTSAGVLLRRLHDATATFPQAAGDRWLLPPRSPAEVICHGDVAPYNCTVLDGRVVGFIDFDTAHPAPRRWDVAYAVYRFAPLHAPTNPDCVGDPETQARRAARFCQAYGIPADGELLVTVADRLTALMDFMRARAEAGDAAFVGHIADGHLALYQTDLTYLREQHDVMVAAFASLRPSPDDH